LSTLFLVLPDVSGLQAQSDSCCYRSVRWFSTFCERRYDIRIQDPVVFRRHRGGSSWHVRAAHGQTTGSVGSVARTHRARAAGPSRSSRLLAGGDRWECRTEQRNPAFNYNPALFWDADPANAKAKIAAGPNNPVGVVWIDLNKPHYGIHGTPEPGTIGHSASHGCVRLTNWDATRLAALVTKGTEVVFEE